MKRTLPALFTILCLPVVAGCGDDSPGGNDNQAACGNGVIEADEQCDSTDLNGQSCESMGYSRGPLACSTICTFDTFDCWPPLTCGNSTVDPREDCDGTNLNGETCQSLGFSLGTLTCSECRFDASACLHSPYSCQNGIAEPVEQCDMDDLAGQTCDSLGYAGGTLACNPDCTFDTTGCNTCGNGVVDGDDPCDGTDLGGNTCSDVTSHQHGALACLPDCTYDTSGCHTCGNSIVESVESCDDGNTVDWDGCGNACSITEFQVNSYTQGAQWLPSISTAPDGSFVVVWQSDGQDGSDAGIFGQRFDVTGSPVGPEFQVNS